MVIMSRTDRVIEDQVNTAFSKHAYRVQINIMDLSKIMDAGRIAGKTGTNIEIDEAVRAAVQQYRQG